MIVVDRGPLIRLFLQEGRHVSIERGVLHIDPPIPDNQYKSDFESMAAEIVNACGVSGFAYRGYSTGRYLARKASGVTLQFIDLQGDGSPSFAIFNAEIDRARRGKKGGPGTPLPKGQFRVGVNHGFYRFWVKAGIPLPRRLSSFHDYMGKLKFRIFTGRYVWPGSEKLKNQTVQPLTLFHDEIAEKFRIRHSNNCHAAVGQSTGNGHSNGIQFPDYSHADCRQLPDNVHSNMPDMDFAQSQEWWESTAYLATGEINDGYPHQRGDGHADIRDYGDAEIRGQEEAPISDWCESPDTEPFD